MAARTKVQRVTRKVQQRHGGKLPPKQAKAKAKAIVSKRRTSTTTPRRRTSTKPRTKTQTKAKSSSSSSKSEKAPLSSEAKMARQALIASELLSLEADRERVSEISKGAYGALRNLRSGGSGIAARYRVGRLKADKGYGVSNRKRKTVKRKVVNKAKLAKVTKKVQQRHGGDLTQKEARQKARKILVKRGKYQTKEVVVKGKGGGKAGTGPDDPITGATPGTNKYKLQTSGGTYHDLELWRRLSYWDRKRLLRKRHFQGRNLTNMVRDRFDRGPEYDE